MAVGTVEGILREFFAAQPVEIIAAYLFGSVARGTAGARSDVDVAVLYAAPPPATLEGLPLDLEGRIEELVNRPAQVIVLNTAPAGLVHFVLRDGVLLLDRDPGAQRILRPPAHPRALSAPARPGAVTDPELLP